ncbi:Ger(x)C family spore germination protein [Tumebacillus sp. ITR2]|uniref:Ger(X)C family spore germination protein n=1 Tax=Tumebacillus amylolyticus TaxID=2801339 RepID=A0ABS1JAM9_9BACL|nr:Ger(x)C family spore germination protein [Tumebacillus amylolyticus]MBL0387230.1 Ger(x)C family spore germination protein [Tumebacillus amylolyticus]
MKKRAWLFALALAVGSTGVGCGARQQRQLEQLGVISAVGYDQAEHENITGTVVIPNFTDTGKEKIDVLTGTGGSSKELRFALSRMSERKLVSGQIRVVLYGDKLAREGIMPYSDTLFRDVEIGSQIYLAVVDGRAVDFFAKRYPDKPSVDIYLYRMLRKEMEQNTLPRSNLHHFLHDVYDHGSDPVLPYLRLGKEDIIIDGVAVFKDDVMVGRLDPEETRYLAYLGGGNSMGEVDVTLQEKTRSGEPAHAVVMYMKVKRKLDISQVQGHPKIVMHYEIDGAVTEYSGDSNLEEEPNIKKIELAIQKKMETSMKHLLHTLQHDYGSDPLGLIELYRSKGYVTKLDNKTGEDLYKKAELDVKVKMNILQTGMIH